MSDVRGQLAEMLNALSTVDAGGGWYIADAILERFDVTPKPVVSAEELGEMIVQAVKEGNGPKVYAAKLLGKLSDAGLKIVRVDDES
jgi:hypothetical protein